MKFSFGNIAQGLAVNGAERSGIHFRMVWNRQRLTGAVGSNTSQLDVAATLIHCLKPDVMKNSDDFLPG
jgi:hypothetical protein